MNLEGFLKRRETLQRNAPPLVERCLGCHRPPKTCYCAHIRSFHPGIEFAILIHPVEFRRRVATGRMSHLCLEGSHFFQVADLSQEPRIDALIDDPANQCVVLYPGPKSLDLGHVGAAGAAAIFPPDRKLVVFVIDGTWNTAGGMLRSHPRVEALPRICFVPPAPSNFRVRKQPKRECFSTLEAIHHTIELLGPARGFDVSSRRHDNLLHVFTKMVDMHIELNTAARLEGRFSVPRKFRRAST